MNLDTVKKATSWYQRYGATWHTENVTWSGELILSSCKDTLRLKILEEVIGFNESKKGGPTFFYILMMKIVATSQTALRGLVTVLNNTTLKEFGGENVFDCASFYKAAATLLKDNNMLPNDILETTFKTFGSSSCDEFNSLVNAMKNAIDLGLKEYSLEEIIHKFEADYNDRIGSSRWPAKDTKSNQQSTFGANTNGTIICFNCGDFHLLKDCNKPFDQVAIEKRKQVIMGGRTKQDKTKQGDNGNPNKNSKKDKDSNNQKKEDKSSSKTHVKKIPPKAGESHEREVNGRKIYWCGKCASWTSHKTSDHKEKQEKKEESAGLASNEEAKMICDNIGGASCLNF